MEKEFEFGLVLGRFHHLHNGHMQVIDISRKKCRKTLILIGSSQESGTLRNPFKVETRRKVISEIYGNCNDVIIGTLTDMTNEDDISFEWGKYILENVEKMYGKLPDVLVYGNDESRKGWFSPEDSKKFSQIVVPREQIQISATQLRQYLAQDNKQEWEKYVPEKIWGMYEELRKELIQVEGYGKREE